MASFTVVVGDPNPGRPYQLEAEEQDANRFMGKSIGEEVDGGSVGLDGYIARDHWRLRTRRAVHSTARSPGRT